jgi:hypothetical protein
MVPNAAIVWQNAVDAVPATSETKGNVTVNNMGSPGRPAFFEASFSMYAKVEIGGQQTTMYFTPSIPVHNLPKDASFLRVEDEAVLKLAEMLRAVADDCERQVAAFGLTSSDEPKGDMPASV